MTEHLHIRRDAEETVRIYDGAGDLVGALDLAGDGRVLGIEFLDAGRRVPVTPGD